MGGGIRLEPGRNCWKVVEAKRAALIVDAADYYRLAQEAMLKARSQIFLVGWDVDTRVRLVEGKGPEGAPAALGPFLTWLSKRRPELAIHILVWDQAMLSIPGRGTTLFRLLRWRMNDRINVCWDSSHPLNASHHQKILVIDDVLAFCGGIDVTADRWDTRRHRDEEPGRKRPFTRRRYGPWHDATMAVDGPAAKALGELSRKRWEIAAGTPVGEPSEADERPWPAELSPSFRDVELAIARTRGRKKDLREVREIEALFVDLIGCARRHVYIETQYFASRVIAEAIGRRLEEEDGPEFVIINPESAEGWLEEAVMGPARYELMHALRAKDRFGRFRIYTPVTEGGRDIYVHAKLMFVDDLYLRCGSANMNNRSMGLDSECDLLIDGTRDEKVRSRIEALRTDMLAEHLGCTAAAVRDCFAETGALIDCIERLRGNGRTLIPFEPSDPGEAARALAQSELLDPESADELFEPSARPGLLARLKRGGRRRKAGAGLSGGAGGR